MKKTIVALYAVTVLAFAFGSVFSQPPGEKDKGSKKDKKGPPSFQLGKVLPPFVRDGLDLTKDQEKAIAELEKEVRARLLNILTVEQVERLKQLKDPKGPPKDKGGRIRAEIRHPLLKGPVKNGRFLPSHRVA